MTSETVIFKPAWINHGESPIWTVDIQPGSLRFATGGGDAQIKIWSTSPLFDESLERIPYLREPLCIARYHEAEIHSLRWSTNGQFLASGDADGLVVVWEQQKKYTPLSSSSLASSSSSSLSSSSLNHNEVWSVKWVLKAHSAVVQDIAWSPSGQFIATASMDERILIWQIPSNEKSTVPLPKEKGNKETKSGKRKSSAPKENKSVPSTKTLTKPFLVLDSHTSWVQGLSWDPFGRYLASFGNDKQVILWQAGTGDRTLPSENTSTTKDTNPEKKKNKQSRKRNRHHHHQRSKYSGSPDDEDESNDDENDGDQEVVYTQSVITSVNPAEEISSWTQLTTVNEPYQECNSEGDIRRIDWTSDGSSLVTSHALIGSQFTAPLLSRSTLEYTVHLAGHIRPVTVARSSTTLFMEESTRIDSTKLPSSTDERMLYTYPCCAIGSLDGSISIWRSRPHSSLVPLQTNNASSTAIPVAWEQSHPFMVLSNLFSAPVGDIAWGSVPDIPAFLDIYIPYYEHKQKQHAKDTNRLSTLGKGDASTAAVSITDVPWKDVYNTVAPRTTQRARVPFLITVSVDGTLAVVMFANQGTKEGGIGIVADSLHTVKHLAGIYGVPFDNIKRTAVDLPRALESSEIRRQMYKELYKQEALDTAESSKPVPTTTSSPYNQRIDMDTSSTGSDDTNSTDNNVNDQPDSTLSLDAVDIVLYYYRRQLLYGRLLPNNEKYWSKLPLPTYVPEIPDVVIHASQPQLTTTIINLRRSIFTRASTVSSSLATALPQQQRETITGGGKRRIIPMTVELDSIPPVEPKVTTNLTVLPSSANAVPVTNDVVMSETVNNNPNETSNISITSSSTTSAEPESGTTSTIIGTTVTNPPPPISSTDSSSIPTTEIASSSLSGTSVLLSSVPTEGLHSTNLITEPVLPSLSSTNATDSISHGSSSSLFSGNISALDLVLGGIGRTSLSSSTAVPLLNVNKVSLNLTNLPVPPPSSSTGSTMDHLETRMNTVTLLGGENRTNSSNVISNQPKSLTLNSFLFSDFTWIAPSLFSSESNILRVPSVTSTWNSVRLRSIIREHRDQERKIYQTYRNRLPGYYGSRSRSVSPSRRRSKDYSVANKFVNYYSSAEEDHNVPSFMKHPPMWDGSSNNMRRNSSSYNFYPPPPLMMMPPYGWGYPPPYNTVPGEFSHAMMYPPGSQLHIPPWNTVPPANITVTTGTSTLNPRVSIISNKSSGKPSNTVVSINESNVPVIGQKKALLSSSVNIPSSSSPIVLPSSSSLSTGNNTVLPFALSALPVRITHRVVSISSSSLSMTPGYDINTSTVSSIDPHDAIYMEEDTMDTETGISSVSLTKSLYVTSTVENNNSSTTLIEGVLNGDTVWSCTLEKRITLVSVLHIPSFHDLSVIVFITCTDGSLMVLNGSNGKRVSNIVKVSTAPITFMAFRECECTNTRTTTGTTLSSSSSSSSSTTVNNIPTKEWYILVTDTNGNIHQWSIHPSFSSSVSTSTTSVASSTPSLVRFTAYIQTNLSSLLHIPSSVLSSSSTDNNSNSLVTTTTTSVPAVVGVSVAAAIITKSVGKITINDEGLPEIMFITKDTLRSNTNTTATVSTVVNTVPRRAVFRSYCIWDKDANVWMEK